MPVGIKVTVEVSRKLREAASRGPQIVLGYLRGAMNASVLTVETEIKEYMTEIGLVDTGLMRSRVHGRVVSAQIHSTVGEVAINDKRGHIHEYGGTIVPKNGGGALAIPFNKESAQIQAAAGTLRNVSGLYTVRSGGHAFLFKSGSPHIGWTLVKSVHIHEKRFMRTGLARAMPKVREFFQKGTEAALNAVLGKGTG